MITYAIGDVHGCLSELEQVLFRINEYHVGAYGDCPRKYVFLGDYVDRGPASKGVIQRLMDLEASLPPECTVFLRGNHEDMLLHDFGNFLYNGGVQTLESYGYDRDNEEHWSMNLGTFIPENHREWIRKTQFYHNDGLRTFVHAGVDRQRGWTLEEMPEPVLLWIRGEFLRDPSPELGYVVHGHTPMENGDIPMEKPNRVNLDTGCVFGGVLTAALFTDEQTEPVLFIKSDRHSKEGPYSKVPIIGGSAEGG